MTTLFIPTQDLHLANRTSVHTSVPIRTIFVTDVPPPKSTTMLKFCQDVRRGGGWGCAYTATQARKRAIEVHPHALKRHRVGRVSAVSGTARRLLVTNDSPPLFVQQLVPMIAVVLSVISAMLGLTQQPRGMRELCGETATCR